MSEAQQNAVQQKEKRIRRLMAEKGIDALLLEKVSSFAWATDGGASYINTAATKGTSQLLYTPDNRHLITDNIESPRLLAEEGLAAQGWEIHAPGWYEGKQLVAQLTEGMALGADGLFPGAQDLSGAVMKLRMNLTEREQARMRELGVLCAAAIDAAIRRVTPGQTELEIAAILAQESQKRGAQPIVNLIATDENIFRYRHPLPTDKKMGQYAMLVLCGRKWGLVVSITRLVHFGLLSSEIRQKMEACARVDATFITATRPGTALDQIFEQAQRAYGDVGFEEEWQNHHQGGPAGYEPREIIVTPATDLPAAAGQAYAWNPSIKGVKCEDTILVGEEENEVITRMDRWPTIDITVNNKTLQRPGILEVI